MLKLHVKSALRCNVNRYVFRLHVVACCNVGRRHFSHRLIRRSCSMRDANLSCNAEMEKFAVQQDTADYSASDLHRLRAARRVAFLDAFGRSRQFQAFRSINAILPREAY